ncbi:unnamed protein product [Mycena citricolor]|uniref:Zn(2)-C6 fungal-type domain-containing protein n=1 Tax=Mycena citricolor TaxID=2018698 RepID=A0AAD2HD19_9AGAR|nr:unnamed protein product [Mycena citricolor]
MHFTFEKKKKPPACDACKARRVLCHPQPNGMPCPRCVEKGEICKTTYVPRGRPRKNGSACTSSDHDSAITGSGNGSSMSASASPPEDVVAYRSAAFDTNAGLILSSPLHPSSLLPSPDLSPELVKHLWEFFTHSMTYRHPFFHSLNFASTLGSASWRPELLPIEPRVLAYCICAAGAVSSVHPSILGPGICPTSLLDESVFYPGADLRAYGRRRAPIRKALFEKAVDWACAAKIHLHASELNAASCFVLACLDDLDEKPTTRPWATSYMSHIRCISMSLTVPPPIEPSRWGGFLMRETFIACLKRTPIIASYEDQILLCGKPPPSLDALMDTISLYHNSHPHQPKSYAILKVALPMFSNITAFARELQNKITGEVAHRTPLDEPFFITFLESLRELRAMTSVLFNDADFSSHDHSVAPGESALQNAQFQRDWAVRSCACAMHLAYVHLIMELYIELVGFRSVNQEEWTQRRVDVLRDQVRDLIVKALPDVEKMLKIYPWMAGGDYIFKSCVKRWAAFCVREMEGYPELLRQLRIQLRAITYVDDDPENCALLDQVEAGLQSAPQLTEIVGHPETTAAAAGTVFSELGISASLNSFLEMDIFQIPLHISAMQD